MKKSIILIILLLLIIFAFLSANSIQELPELLNPTSAPTHTACFSTPATTEISSRFLIGKETNGIRSPTRSRQER